MMSRRRSPPDERLTSDEILDLEALDRRLYGGHFDQAAADLVMLRPADCTLHMPAAVFDTVPDADSTSALIAEIAVAGGNHYPVLVRQITEPVGPRYALLVGARRHFAVNWLNHNGRPELRLLARLVTTSDEEAFRICEHHNRGRSDISELARARSHRLALDLFYDGVQSRMAAALDISSSHLNRLLSLADLPEAVIAAFGRRQDLRVRHAEVLAPLLRQDHSRRQMIDEAERIDREQQELSSAAMPLLPAALVLARLKNAGERYAASGMSTRSIRCHGEDVGSIWCNPEGAIQLGAIIQPSVPNETVVAAIETALRSLRHSG